MLSTLLVEDNRFFRQSFRKVLHDHFPAMQITEAGDGKEALEKFRICNPDLVFLDINLPDTNGLEIAKKFRSEPGRCFIFILTSYNLPDTARPLLKTGPIISSPRTAGRRRFWPS